jgi:acyl carrier protein
MKQYFPAPATPSCAVIHAEPHPAEISAPLQLRRERSQFAYKTAEEIRHDLCGFPPSCIEAALRFRKTEAPEALFAMLPGFIEFHLPSGATKLPRRINDEHRLNQDLGLDSLSLAEMAFKIDDLFGLAIETREMAGIATVGDLKAFLLGKLAHA